MVILTVPSLSNSQYLALSFNWCMNCTIDSLGCCLVSRNFVLSAMTNLFFGLISLFITLLISSHPAVVRKMSIISFCFPLLHLSLSFFTLASASKRLIHVSTYSGMLSVIRHPIGDAIVVPWKSHVKPCDFPVLSVQGLLYLFRCLICIP